MTRYVFDTVPFNDVMKRACPLTDDGQGWRSVPFPLALADTVAARDGRRRAVSADVLYRRQKYGGRKGRSARLR